MFKYHLLHRFGKAMDVGIRKGADTNQRDSIAGYPYAKDKRYLSGVIQLVASWTAIGHSVRVNILLDRETQSLC